MAKQRVKTHEITITESKGMFSIFRRTPVSKDIYEFEGVSALRKVLSNEKARILNAIKTQNPKSIYELTKMLNRSFKSVNDDVRLLERFGFIDLIEEKTKNRRRYRPEIIVDTITIHLHI